MSETSGLSRMDLDPDLKEAFGKFEVVKNLGKVAEELQRQADDIGESLSALAPSEALEAPEGMAFRFETLEPKDSMRAEIWRSEYQTTIWTQLFIYEYDQFEDGPKRIHPTGFRFDSARIQCDPDYKVWAYNKNGWLRVLFDHSIGFTGLVAENE